MRTALRHASHLATAALLAMFAAAKLAAPPDADRPAWLVAALVVVAALELALAAWLALERTSPRPVLAAAALGVLFVAAAVLAPSSWWAPGGCGCLGAVRAEQGHRALAAGALLLVAGLRLLCAPSVGTGGARAAQ